jgi:hypothetical protein
MEHLAILIGGVAIGMALILGGAWLCNREENP